MKRILVLAVLLSVFSGTADATDRVMVGFSGDSIHVGYTYAFEIFIENDALLGDISLPFDIYADDGVVWTFQDMGGFEATPNGGTFVVGIPGSRWMSGDATDGSCWDLIGTLVVDSPAVEPYTFGIGGSAIEAGLEPGPLQHMLDVYFSAETQSIEVLTLCIDEAVYPPSGQFIFSPGGHPSHNLPLCVPVTIYDYQCPVWDSGLPTSMELLHCETGQVTVSATDPQGDDVQYHIHTVTGDGTVSVGLWTGVVTYLPAPTDVGQTVQILVEAGASVSPPGVCMDVLWVLDVTVNNTPPSIDCGSAFNYAAPPNILTKQDISATDPDACENLTYSVISVVPTPVGPFDIDPMTGEFTFQPDAADGMMSFTFQIEVTDGVTSAAGEFMVDVIGQESVIGDPNVDGETNVADAVMIINFIFKGGSAPDIMNSADVNADCVVNIADAVYIIQYVFQGGPEPQLGCVYQ